MLTYRKTWLHSRTFGLHIFYLWVYFVLCTCWGLVLNVLASFNHWWEVLVEATTSNFSWFPVWITLQALLHNLFYIFLLSVPCTNSGRLQKACEKLEIKHWWNYLSIKHPKGIISLLSAYQDWDIRSKFCYALQNCSVDI